MRSDVKVGLICAVVLLLGFVAIFAWSGPKSSDRSRDVPGARQPALTVGDAATQPGGLAGSVLGGPATQTSDSGSIFGARTARAQDYPTTTAPGATQPSGFTINVPQTQPTGNLGLSGTNPATSPTTRPVTGGTPGGLTGGTPGGLTGGTPGGLTGGTPGGLTGGTPGGLTGGIPGDGLGGGRPDMPGFGGGTTTTAPAAATEYTVKKGDSIWTIAKAHKVSRAALAAANGIAVDSPLKEKQKLKIPAEGTGLTASTRPATTRPATSRPAATATAPSTQPATYKVKAGDTLRKIAKSVYGDEAQWKKIYSANKSAIGADPNDISVGQTLKIPH